MRTPGETPARVDRRVSLPPVKGGAVAHQARKAFGPPDEPGASGVSSMPGTMIPHRLPSLQLPPLLGTQDKGKGPSSGKPVPKKTSPYTSSEEDIAAESKGATNALAAPGPPLSPRSNLNLD